MKQVTTRAIEMDTRPQAQHRTKAVLKSSVGFAVMALILAGNPATAEDEKAFTMTHDDAQLKWGSCPEFMPKTCGLAILQGDPAQENTDVLFRLRAGSTAPQHWHTSAERMVLLTGAMQVDYDGQDPVVLQRDTYAYGPPELPHSATCQSSEDCVLFISFDQPIDAMAVDN